MGYGAFLKVVNNRATVIQTFVVNVECMYDQGQEGSPLSLFNNAVIPGIVVAARAATRASTSR